MPSLSQKHRPQTFAAITGQAHVTETLRKEVATGILGHAFLFSGPRGVGKTTTARVFAKALNCAAPKDGEPCAACGACLATDAGRQVDLIELDAATHTGVDMVREAIIDHVRVTPMGGHRKVYVLDEAHMLSGAAWNALLKTLEEPPPYAFFILATTEWHKVPATIVSRCQRFEFKRIPDGLLSARVKEIASAEGWKVDDDVVKLIVSRADGCVRDAETLLGQIGSLGEAHLTMDVAGLVIPPSRIPQAAALLRAWASRDQAKSLDELQALFDSGLPLLQLFDDLIAMIRRLLLASIDPATVEQWKQGIEDDRSLVPLVGAFSPMELHDLALVLMERRRDVRGGLDPLFALQLAGTLVTSGCLGTGAPRPVATVPFEAPKTARSDSSAPSDSARNDTSSAPSSKLQAPSSVDAPTLATIRSKWNAIVRAVGEKNLSLPFILKIVRPEAVNGTTVVLRFQYSFHRDKVLGDGKNRQLLEQVMRELLASPSLAIEGIVGEDDGNAEARSQDVVHNILHAFGGNVVEQPTSE